MNNIIKDSLAALYRLENDALNSRDGYGYSGGDAETIRRAISENEALRKENEELKAKLDKAKDALRFYADKESYIPEFQKETDGSDFISTPIIIDYGQSARTTPRK